MTPATPAEGDRTVCAAATDGTEIVRYQTTGRWYAEKVGAKRQRLTLDTAAKLARSWRTAGIGDVIADQPGGGHFYRKVFATGVRSRL